jgi:hypothetical protein
MAKLIDLGARREQRHHQRKDARTAELKDALRTARTGHQGGYDEGHKARSTRNLLDLYKRKNPPEKR